MKPSEFDYRLWCKEDNSYWSFNDEQQRIIPRNDNIWEIELWSGSKDKDGKKIFEGDVVSHRNYNDVEYRLKVVFNPERSSFEFICIESPALYGFYGFFEEIPSNELKIIGNIHETKAEKE